MLDRQICDKFGLQIAGSLLDFSTRTGHQPAHQVTDSNMDACVGPKIQSYSIILPHVLLHDAVRHGWI